MRSPTGTRSSPGRRPGWQNSPTGSWTLTTPAGDPVADALLLTRPTGIIRRHQALTVQISLEERPLGPASAAIITALTALADRVKARLVSEDLLDDEVD